jgi:hypothetical protein
MGDPVVDPQGDKTGLEDVLQAIMYMVFGYVECTCQVFQRKFLQKVRLFFLHQCVDPGTQFHEGIRLRVVIIRILFGT